MSFNTSVYFIQFFNLCIKLGSTKAHNNYISNLWILTLRCKSHSDGPPEVSVFINNETTNYDKDTEPHSRGRGYRQ